ncbi:hypothetical protein GQ457_12G018820 [Hibiscus cannabinus]
MQITSLVEARRQEDQGLNHLFKYILVAMVVYEGTETFREGFETFSMKVPKPCPKVSKPWVKISVLPERVVYRSWIFAFDSGIPRVTILGRFCDWTGSRGLQNGTHANE